MKLPHTWCNVHVPPTPSQDEQVDETADVFEAVSKIESQRLYYQNRNLKGKYIMNEATTPTAMETAIKEVIHTRNTNADPLDIIEKHLPNVNRDYWARVASSMAWRLDTAVLNIARKILFDLYSMDELTVDETPAEHFTRFQLDIHDVLRRDSIWTENEVCAEALVLNNLRHQWHDMAQLAASENDRDYRPADLSDMLINEKPMKVRVETRGNYEMIARHQAKKANVKTELDRERLYQERVDQFMRRDQMLAEQRVENNRPLIPVIEAILDQIRLHTPAKAQSFHDLEPLTMRSLTDFAMQTVERVLENDMAKDRKLTMQMFGRMLQAQDAAIEELKKFRDDHCDDKGELENVASAATDAHDRRQKELAGGKQIDVPITVVPADPIPPNEAGSVSIDDRKSGGATTPKGRGKNAGNVIGGAAAVVGSGV